MPKEVRQRVHAAAMAEDVELDDIEEDVEPITHHVGDAASNSSDNSNTAEMEDGVSVLAPGAIRSPRQAAASDLKQRAGDVVGCIQELRSRVAHDEAPGNAKKKLISVNRIGLQARTNFPTTLNVPPPAQQEMLPLFDNAGDDVIKFHRSDDEDGEGTGSDEDVDAKTLQARRKRKIDRDFDEAIEERHAAEEEDEEAERWNEDSSSNSDVFEGSSGSSSSASDGSDDDEEDPSSSEEEVEVKRASPKKTSASVSQTLGRSAYGGITFESHYNRNADSRTAFGCHHTLLGLTGPQTIRGPCAVFGVFNEASCNGFLLGKKNFMVGPKDVAVLQPMSKLSSSASQLSISELLAARQERLSKAVAIPHPAQPGHAAGTKRNDEVWGVGNTHSPEVKFGAIDWDWVANTLQSWLTRLAADKSMSVVLVVEKYLPGELMTRRVQFAQKASHIDRYGSGDSMLIPSCFARKNVPPPVEPALLPVFRKMMISAHSVAKHR
ncbi:Hypothetical protein, putative [Bodo saltans]|uniref:Uncharacterized protein n=1 Tax=Bodo saltans TaxID=75058 RepID=A0A0S4INN1_BODSA|nr:Hypothetical protein, putative [Bodo saltans]|eukprot:CUF69745.1 Hypothetical protein, putative [Bodo saltans]